MDITTNTHAEQVKNYIKRHYPEWDIEDRNINGENIDICENGDVHYEGFFIIKTGIKINQ
jgi:hypothetical protein